MNILVVCEGDGETGNSWSGSTVYLLRHLRALGHSVRCADVELYGWRRWLAAALAFRLPRRRWAARFHLGAGPFRLRSFVAARQIENHSGRADVILQIGVPSALPERLDAPYALYCDSNILFSTRSSRGAAHGDATWLSEREVAAVCDRERRVYHGASAIFTMSEALRHSLVEDFGVPPTRVHTVYAGANLDVSRIPERVERNPASPPTILFVGRAFERKGGPLLLDAFARVRRARPDARLVIVGPERFDAGPGVETLGFLSREDPAARARLERAYREATVYCMPTEFEPFGIAFVEAMFWSLPCIGPNAWAVPEIIKDGVTGFLAPPGSVDCLSQRLLELISDRELSRAMGHAGRERALATFTWSTAAERIAACLLETIPSSTAAQ